MDKVIEKIKGYYSKLTDDYDGEGSPAPSKLTLEHATVLAIFLGYSKILPPNVTLGVNGSIYFEWDSFDTWTEVEIIEDTFEFRVFSQGCCRCSVNTTSVEEIKTCLDTYL